ncbi:iron chelate uptake ABC transporter family permease subunit [Aliirhizobium smilacinae]|uniref:Iron chelate uptake ABC transporter family permease subunit n=2 Tax=Aliirhizobium smilacinae TaxID=1395944 RepID=A0A5C4X8E7_9HYPH|nr:iron chelate uptake ABC transporter family permease subunit [Rhizobium smilacinae]TNM59765.1 iron chelate uptake ABC transporter family permease subunit [Rhizobium smilacinae]
MVAFMTLGAKGSWSFVLSFRGTRLAAMLIVAYAIAVSTVLFQTITGNRILTPALTGFDALYVLLQTSIVFLFGAATLTGLDPQLMFIAEVAIMVGFSLALYRLLFGSGRHNVHLVVLIGIVLGGLFRSMSGFLQRIISPDDFVVLQDRLFASFNVTDQTLVGVSALLIGLVTIAIWRMFSVFDVMMLGRDTAVALGVDHKAMTMRILVLISVLVSISTALVGPVTFFGLLVANLAYILMPAAKHRIMLPAAVLVAIICLVGGQTILERVFAFDTALSIIIEFAGGLFFIVFLLKGRVR